MIAFRRRQKLLLPLLMIIVILGILGGTTAFLKSRLTISDLIPHNGKIRSIQLVSTKGYRKKSVTTYHLDIVLEGRPKIFRVYEYSHQTFLIPATSLKNEDNVTIFTSPYRFPFNSLSDAEEVYHLTKGKEVIVDFRRINYEAGFYWIGFLMAGVFLMIFLDGIKQERKRASAE